MVSLGFLPHSHNNYVVGWFSDNLDIPPSVSLSPSFPSSPGPLSLPILFLPTACSLCKLSELCGILLQTFDSPPPQLIVFSLLSL